MAGAVSYLATVKKALHDEPEKYEEFMKIMIAFKDQRYMNCFVPVMFSLLLNNILLLFSL